jgi:predicted CoA-substrate-specific enzyme activase
MRRRISAGVDIGARTIDIVLFDGRKVLDSIVLPTGARPRDRAAEAFMKILAKNGLCRKQLSRTVSTGYGRNHFPYADEAVSEITCHAAGASFLFPGTRLVLDIGGQDSKAILCCGDGCVIDFAMNDRCAAGTGRFIEIVMEILDLKIEDISRISYRHFKGCEISSMCAVFAESEIIGLLQNNIKQEQIIRGIFKSVARRTMSMMGSSFRSDCAVFSGGVARIKGVAESLEEEIGAKIKIPANPQITGALGAAIIAIGIPIKKMKKSANNT